MDTPPEPRARPALPALENGTSPAASTDAGADPGMELVWFDIDLDTIEEYDTWKPESLEWAMTVDWARINELVRHNIEGYPLGDFSAAMASAECAGLNAADQEGLASFYHEPIFATPHQIYGGGHRITAMRQQGVRWAVGICYRADIGEGPDASVHPLVAYLPGSSEPSGSFKSPGLPESPGP